MDKPERLRRPDAARTEPIRDFASYVRAAGQTKTTAAGPDADLTDHAVAHGVKLGYSVIDEQIRQGEKLAERLRQIPGKPDAMPAIEVGTLIERALNVYKDMGALAVSTVETLVRNPVLQSAIARSWQANAATQATPPAPGSTSSAFGFELISSRRTQVKLDIKPQAVTFMPVVHALHASNQTLPPLTGVRFRFDPATSVPVLQIDVADSQPAGTYLGVIVDSATDEPCGTLSVRVLPGTA